MFDYEPDPAFWGGMGGLLILAFFFVMAVVWFFLPFAIFGVKAKLDLLIAETRAAKKATETLANELRTRKPG